MWRTALGILVGVVGGGIVNMALIMLGSTLVPAPAGMDVTDTESVAAHAHLFEPQHFIAPFVAHAAGTFVGAFVAFLLAREHRRLAAGVVGGVMLAGGISAAHMVPAPLWFLVADLALAYVPMAWLAALAGAGWVEADSAA
ncbi:MAG: hypothetical protein AAF529_00255 [Pseudomonadota bacterium]